MRENPRNEYNSFSLLRFVFSKWKIFLIVMVAAAVLSFICASLIRPHYRATAVVFAPRTNAISKVLLADETNNERLDIKAYAIEEETEQMMEILGSRDIKDAIIKKYNMLEHYDLDTNQKYWQTKLYKYMTQNLVIKRTKYGAISITFEDYDPVLACNVANDVLDLLDSVKRRMENERAAAAYAVMEKQLMDVNAEIARIDDTLKMIMEHGVFEFEGQSERVMQQYAIAVAQGNNAAVQRLEAELEKLATWGPRAHALAEVQFNFRKYQSLVKQKMMDAKVDMENEIPTKFVVERAIVPDKKSYPKKSIVMTLSIVGSLIVTLFILLMVENLKGMPSRREEETANA
ncbi:MAG: hypothetical protein J6Y35_01490 [Bacteroidales bacterium]|nr:hypothetical protein [Bacteroidales bacterium]